jgi:hypothetical protein
VVGRLDPLTPLLLLSVIGISVSLYRWSQERGETAGALGMAVAWLIINVAVLLVQPRYVVGHLLVWALPAALWVSRGWSSFMRVLLTPSVFVRAVGLAFTFLLAIWLWLPLRAIRDAILIALQATL